MSDSLRGLILDFDGTIAETERSGHRVAYNHAFRELRLAWHWDEALYGNLLAVAGGKERLRHYIERYEPALPARADIGALIADIHRAKILHFTELAPAIPFRTGVQRLVYEAHLNGVRIAIATTGAKAGVEAVIAQDPAFAEMIDIIAASEAVEKKKPAPDVYTWVLERLGFESAECVAIEDSNIGLRAALGASIPTIITVSDYTRHEEFDGALAVVSSLGDGDVPARSLAGIRPTAEVVDVAFLRAVRAAEGPARMR